VQANYFDQLAENMIIAYFSFGILLPTTYYLLPKGNSVVMIKRAEW